MYSNWSEQTPPDRHLKQLWEYQQQLPKGGVAVEGATGRQLSFNFKSIHTFLLVMPHLGI